MELNQKHLDAIKLLGNVENEEFLIILANYFRAKAEFEKLVSELEEDPCRISKVFFDKDGNYLFELDKCD